MKRMLLLCPVLVMWAAACSSPSTLRSSHPILPVQDYEQLLVGNFEADYIGDANCLAKCHKHDKISKDFNVSIHGEQISSETGLPLVNCESCHGPGSLAVANAEQTGKCDVSQFLPIESFPAQAQSQICLKCHSAASTPVLQHWNAGIHANSDVSCFDCHQLHIGPQQKVSRQDEEQLCARCHPQVRAEFAQFSRHPVPEHKMACTDCHDPHGAVQDHNLRTTVKELCTRCHMEFQGPFVFEHADLTHDCTNCHRPHGSPNDQLLNVGQPFLCLQCHSGHQDRNHPSLVSGAHKAAFFTRCTDCHSTIHGTNVPSAKGRGTFMAR